MRILLIVYDNGSRVSFFPQGIAYIAASLKKAGHDVVIAHQDVYHSEDNGFTYLLDRAQYDVVGLGFNAGYYQYKKCLSIAQAVNRSKNRSKFKFVLGGHGPAAAPDYFLNKFEADRVVRGEGEDIIAFTGHTNYINIEPLKIESIPWPAYDMFPMDVYRLIRWPTSTDTDFCMPILTGRGCPYKCTFCYRMHEGDFRPRDPLAVIEEMEMLHKDYGINHFQFSDELFMSSAERVVTFCDALADAKITNLKWDCNGRLNFARPEVLKSMKWAGCEYINYGIEALDSQVLKNIRKGLTVTQIRYGVDATIKAGITPGLNIMWGNRGDTTDTLFAAVQFLLMYDTCAELRTIRPMTPYPGSAEFKDLGWTAAEFYEDRHKNSDLLTVNHTDMSDQEFHLALASANMELIRNYYIHHTVNLIEKMTRFYSGDEPNFRGFRPV